jgi:GNAT superfamily N-acetyltransferase
MGYTLQEKIAEVEGAGCTSAWRRPDSLIIDRPDWFQITTPSSKHYSLNGVARAILRADDAPRIVAETIAAYRAAGQDCRWILGPSSAPSSLGGLLEANGLMLRYPSLGMVAETDHLKVPHDPAVAVTRVTKADIADYVTACVAGWGNSEETGRGIFADMTLALQDPAHALLYFVARVDGQPAASGALLPLARSGYLLASSVVPQFRGKGVYRALVAKRLDVLRSMGIPLVTIQAIAHTSAPICAKLGFETVCEMRSYVSGGE